jgi:hypothetical protein
VSTVAGVIMTATVFAPSVQAAIDSTATAAQIERATNIAAQFSLFMAIGLLLSGFIAAVAARLGGMQSEEMHART